MVAGFPELLFLDFKASAEEETIEDLVQLYVVIWLSVVQVAVDVDLPAFLSLVSVGGISGDGPGLAIGFLLALVTESVVEEIDDTAERLEQNGEPRCLGEYGFWSGVPDSGSTNID